MADRKATGTGGYAVKLTPETKEKLEKVQDVLERAYRLVTPRGVKPPRITQAYTVEAALNILLAVVREEAEIFKPGVVQHLMAESGRMIANGVLKTMGEHTARVELEDGKPYLIRPPADPIEILVDLPDAEGSGWGNGSP